MKKSIFFTISFTLFLILTATYSIAQQPLSGKVLDTKLQKIQSDSLNNYGTLWAWGGNEWGYLGDGTTVNRLEPIKIGNDYNWKFVTCGDNYGFAIKNDGTLWGCGGNVFFGNGTTDSTHLWKQIAKEKDWKFVSSNYSYLTLAIKTDGSLWAWGKNTYGCLGDSTLKNHDSILSPKRIGKGILDDVIIASTGRFYSAAIRKDGTLFTWGSNYGGVLGDGSQAQYRNYPVQIGKTGEWLAVSCGVSTTSGIKKDGTLWAWGSNGNTILGNWTIKTQYSPIQIGNDNDWLSVSITNEHIVALKQNGTLWAWGMNHYFGRGDSTMSEDSLPTLKLTEPKQIGTDTDWVSISADEQHNTAIKKNGSLWRWGRNYVDTNMLFKTPTKFKNIDNVVLSECGSQHIMFIRRHTAELPEVITWKITNITASTAESGGEVTYDGGENEVVRGVCYSLSQSPTIKDNITKDGTGAGKFKSLMTNLKLFQTYYVRAYATNSAGTAYGEEETFKVTLSKPILISPENLKTEVPLNTSLTWNKVDSALKYRVQLATNPAFDTLLVDEETVNLTYLYDKYENNTVYYWRVQALHNEETSDWSVVWEFTTLKFNPQVLISPSDDTINVPVDCELIWKQNSAKTSYILQVSKFQNFSQKVIDIDLADTTHQSSVLECLTSYYWRVAAYNGTDQSDWSPIWKFTTLMDSVNLKTPIDLSKCINIPTALVWQDGIYKKDYRVQISESIDFATTNTDTLITKTANADVKNLNYWQKYFWRVRNESGDTLGYWSEIWQFKTRMSDILLVYPENTQTGLEQEINFKWNQVIGAEYYQLQISKNDNFTDLVYSSDSITTTEKMVPDLEKDILYFWRVRVWNTESIGTAFWSEVWTFRTGETSVKDESEYIQIIPNPAGDFITIALKPSDCLEPSEGSAIQIYNTLGEKVMSVEQTPSSVQRINIYDLPKGVYFVKVGGDIAKFVKM